MEIRMSRIDVAEQDLPSKRSSSRKCQMADQRAESYCLAFDLMENSMPAWHCHGRQVDAGKEFDVEAKFSKK
jgi:hypothetical protein